MACSHLRRRPSERANHVYAPCLCGCEQCDLLSLFDLLQKRMWPTRALSERSFSLGRFFCLDRLTERVIFMLRRHTWNEIFNKLKLNMMIVMSIVPSSPLLRHSVEHFMLWRAYDILRVMPWASCFMLSVTLRKSKTRTNGCVWSITLKVKVINRGNKLLFNSNSALKGTK